MPLLWPRHLLRRRKKDLSIVVVAYNIPRELPRTLFSLSADYQRDISAGDYEVIVVDNGSNPPVERKLLERYAGVFRLLRIDAASPSPAAAVNRGIAAAKGDIVGVMIDGARLATPGLAHFARQGARLYPCPVVTTLGWYLGFDFQRWSMRNGYDTAQEDALLASIDWPRDGYRLFDIGTMDESSVDGWFQPIAESNALFMPRASWAELGGLDESFTAPGGGYLNLDTFARALGMPTSRLVVLLGEATFHQVHGGVATNIEPERMVQAQAAWSEQYQAIRGRPYRRPEPEHRPTYVGTLPRPALSRFVRAAIDPFPGAREPPLGAGFDRDRWALAPPAEQHDDTMAALVALMQQAFRAGHNQGAAAVARLICSRMPDEPEAQRVLSLTAPWLEWPSAGNSGRIEYHLALAEAHRVLAEHQISAEHYRAALSLNPGSLPARIALDALQAAGK